MTGDHSGTIALSYQITPPDLPQTIAYISDYWILIKSPRITILIWFLNRGKKEELDMIHGFPYRMLYIVFPL